MTTLNSVLMDGRRTRYYAVSRILHWPTLLLLLPQFPLCWLMPDVDSVKTPQGLVAWHVGVDTLLLVVVIVRLLWAAMRRSPADVQQSAVLRFAAKALQAPVCAASCRSVAWMAQRRRSCLGCALGRRGGSASTATPDSLGATIGEWHATSAIVLLALIGLHVMAAIIHQVGFKDRTIRRML
jgi:cytochrome b561